MQTDRMKPSRPIILFFAGSLFFHTAHTQPTVDSVFRAFRPFMAMHYSARDLRKITTWVDSTHTSNNKKFRVKSRLLSGKVVTTDGTFIDFWLYFSRLGLSSDDKLVGTITVYGENKLLEAYKPGFDSVYTAYDSSRQVTKQCFYFYKYSHPTNAVLERVDPAVTGMIKHEYFDLYFTDLNRNTSKWQRTFRNFMQPYSDTFIALMTKGDIQPIFDLIHLQNKGFSWFLAEGLWYYHSLHPCLTPAQQKIVDSYNGHGNMIAFRPAVELKKIYPF